MGYPGRAARVPHARRLGNRGGRQRTLPPAQPGSDRAGGSPRRYAGRAPAPRATPALPLPRDHDLGVHDYGGGGPRPRRHLQTARECAPRHVPGGGGPVAGDGRLHVQARRPQADQRLPGRGSAHGRHGRAVATRLPGNPRNGLAARHLAGRQPRAPGLHQEVHRAAEHLQHPPGPVFVVRTVVLAAIAAAAATAACTPTLPDAARIGDPVPGLTEEELARFDAGRALFDRVFSVDEGTGPLFNENQCSACHTFPEPGGTGEQLVIKATRRLPDGSCDILASEGGENLRRQATPALARLGIERDTIPSATADIATFAVPFLFGLGAADLVPERALHEAADPDDIDGDGISGRVGRTPDGRVGRFGRKADVASLDDFTHLALFNEMGITTTSHARERGPNGAPLPDGVDPAPDPELGDDRVDLITDFVRM
ncbi:MAG: hypothetical protein F4Z31_17430, partial [Gemmatimonadetes bacterium]|nr:hypothetical protein [Gemmatimonadota bacterium]